MNNKGFHVSVTAVSKRKNQSVVAKSAYNSGSKIEDKKNGITHDYTSKNKEKKINLINEKGEKYTKIIDKNLAYATLIIPIKSGKLTVDRGNFWNEIELIETRKNAQFGTEIDVMFPDGLNEQQRIDLVEKYSQYLSDRYNILVDVSIHRPHTHIQHKNDGQIAELTNDNFHAHILLSSREIIAEKDGDYSLSNRKNWSLWSTSERLSKGLNGRGDELKYIRKSWAELANNMLPENKKINEKSYREQGINLLPKMKLGKSLYKDVLKGNRSLIDDYNKTIDSLNEYIKKSGLEIDYNDTGRIDLVKNTQVFNNVEVSYKKRKPYDKFSLDKILLVAPRVELENKNDELKDDIDSATLLDSFLAFSDDLEQQKQVERSALLSTINKLNDGLSNQSKNIITINKTVANTHKYAYDLGKNYDVQRKDMTDLIRQIKIQNELKAVQESLTLLEQFRQNEDTQTTGAVTTLKEQLASIEKTAVNNKKIFNDLIPINNEVIAEYKQLKATLEPFSKAIKNMASDFNKLAIIDIEKTELEQHWEEAFNNLVDIKVTNNLETYNKFAKLADLDVDKYKHLEQERDKLSALKAFDIDAKAEQQLVKLAADVKAFKADNDADIKALKQQINTSEKSYKTLSPFYQQRQELLNQSEAVIEQDDDLYNEITATKTPQLNDDKLHEWRERTAQLHAQLIREHEQAELKKQAELERQQEHERQQLRLRAEREKAAREQDQNEQREQYSKRLDKLVRRVVDTVNDIDFKAVSAPQSLTDTAEKLAKYGFILDAMQNTDNFTDLQKTLRDKDVEKFDPAVKKETDNLLKELSKLPANKQKIEILEQLSERFKQVAEIKIDDTNLNKTLDSQVLKVEQNIKAQTLSYSSPRPF